MKQINVYNFSELSETAQRKAISEHRDHIIMVTRGYITDIWAGNVDEFSELEHFPTINWSAANQWIQSNLTYDEFNYDDFELPLAKVCEIITQMRKQVNEKEFFLREEFNEFCEDPKCGSVLPVFIHKFIDKLFNDATEYMAQMASDESYIYDYLTSNVRTPYACPDTYFDGFTFLEDGTAVELPE